MEIKKTGFHEIHKSLGAKIVEFAGYYMPVQYKGIIDEHKRVRTTVGLFDVSHMGEFIVKGEKALDYLQEMTVNDVNKLKINQVQYSAMCYEHGGIVDDLLVYRLPSHYMTVVNGANLQKDFEWMREHLIPGAEIDNVSDDTSLLAVQGRDAEPLLQKLTNFDLSSIRYYWSAQTALADVDMIVSRTGYTGEDGFELYFSVEKSDSVWQSVMEAGKEFDIEPIGLGARDTLRMEMKYCLYGNDIDQTTNPLEAGLGWITKLGKGDFIGREALLKIKEKGMERKLVGFAVDEKAFPRHGYKLLQHGQQVGIVTSGTFSPILEKGIGLGYVPVELSKVGTELQVEIRGKHVSAQVVKTPFYGRPY